MKDFSAPVDETKSDLCCTPARCSDRDTEDTDKEDAPSKPERPVGVPEKFWDQDRGMLRSDELLQSYLELEGKSSGDRSDQIPPTPDAYSIKIDNELLSIDPDLNQRFHEAGFTQEQVQMVYDLASERIVPLLSEVVSTIETQIYVSRLVEHFGGEQKWRETARQLDTWGQSHLPKRLFDELSRSYEGVITLHRMMTTAEPSIIKDGTHSTGALSDADLKKMMRNPRYWRDHDPEIVETVRSGFKQLYKNTL